MAEIHQTPQPALKYEVEVREHGHVEFDVPFAVGARIVVFVIEESSDTFGGLVAATESSLDFWTMP